MTKKTLAFLSIVGMSATLIFASIGNAAAPAELESLQSSFVSQKGRLLHNYLQQLTTLESTMLNSSNLSGANAVKAEISRTREEISKISQTSSPAPTMKVVTSPPKPAPKPVIIKRDPKTHASEVEGLAGAVNFSKNNIYNFNLADVGAVSTLKIWATGRRSIESTGNIWLKTPDGRREKVTKWKDRNFDEPSTEISSYRKLKPIIEDISNHVTRPGTYKVEFEWTGGIDPLVIYRVELTS